MTLEELQKKYQNIWQEYEEHYYSPPALKIISDIRDALYKDLTDMGYIGYVYGDFLIYSFTDFHPVTLIMQIYKENCKCFV